MPHLQLVHMLHVFYSLQHKHRSSQQVTAAFKCGFTRLTNKGCKWKIQCCSVDVVANTVHCKAVLETTYRSSDKRGKSRRRIFGLWNRHRHFCSNSGRPHYYACVILLQAIYSALIMACLDNDQLDRAGELYQVALEAGLHPDAHAYNGLINAYGRMSEVCLQQCSFQGLFRPHFGMARCISVLCYCIMLSSC